MVQSFRSMSLSMYRRTSGSASNRHNDGREDIVENEESQEEASHERAARLLLEEPLLDQGFRLTNSTEGTARPPGGEAGNDGEDNNNNNNGNGGNLMDGAEGEELQMLLRIFGRSYGSDVHFWFRLVPLSILVGGLVGTIGFIFLGTYRWILFHWVAATASSASNSTLVDALGDDGLKFGSGQVAWIGVTALGGFLVGLVRILPGAPTTMARTMFHDAMDLSGNLRDAPYVLVAAFLCLCAGAPLGPEMSIGTLGSFLASFLVRKACCCMRQTRRRRRSEAALVMAGLAASLGGLFGNPLLSVLLIHELSVVSRPGDDFTLDGLVEKEKAQRGGDGNSPTTVSSSSSIVSVAQEEALRRSLSSKTRDHDYMEQVSLTGIAATVSFLCFQALLSILKIDMGNASQDYGKDASTVSIIPILYAIPLGVLCGLLATLFLICNGVFKKIRVQLGARLEACCARSFSSSLSSRLVALLWSTLAGALHGALAFAFPLTLGSGAELLTDFSSFSQHLPAWYLATTAVVKLVATASCLGLGLVGGQLFPSAFAGACLGASLVQWFSFLEQNVTVACCMVAIPGSFIPIPLTLVLFVALVERNIDLMPPMLVATMVAYAVNGGWGLVGRLARQKLTGAARVLPEGDVPRQADAEDEEEEEEETTMSDGSFLRQIVAAIYDP